MRYSSAVVLSTLAAGSAAASHIHNRHASFHARRQAEVKRSADSNVDWDAIAYDLKDVDWARVNYGAPSSAPAPAPASSSAPAPASSAPAPTPTPEYKAAPKPTPEVKVQAAPAPSSAAPAPAQTSSKPENLGDKINDVVSDLLHGVESIAANIGAKLGKNDENNNGGIWVGNDSPWKATFTNDDNSDAVIYCWKANGFSGMSVNVNVPEVSVGLKGGESVTLSFAPDVPAACAPAFSDTKLALFGGLDNTWWEVTFGKSGCFDVSRNVNMKGNKISSKGSKCTSDMETCVFKCKNPNANSCEAGTDYDLFNCGASNGGGGGYDAVMAGTGGGCAMGANGETVQVTFSK
ncbi:hypothetical protein T440DRAFT_469326 [Plenodomus tracheiphilus IPT5]|uniref:Uncharacterized protein n=1 Tax=Plenodomus tracheiphilus IPT5 TaxID=1408161 RepID=A0A6A7B5D6_9PLEO|nr:hypothetical protein T440DRAFT_469326 [Plenodomus tracheiphilus IPT5]